MEVAERPGWRRAAGEMRPFLVIWAGQMVSVLGSGLTAFAIPVAIYQKTGSAEALGLLMFAWMLPTVLLSPLAGALVDRWDRRAVLIAADAGEAVATLALALLVLNGHFDLGYLFVITVLGACLETFQEPAFSASIAALVPKEHHGRALGMVQLLSPASMIVAPLLGGALLVAVGLGGVIAIDAASFVVAVAGLAVVAIPSPPRAAAGGEGGSGAALRRFVHEAGEGARFLRARPGLMGVLVFFALMNFWMSFVNPLVPALLLSFTSPLRLATVQAAVGAGMLLAGAVISAWGGPRRKMRAMFVTVALAGVAVAALGARAALAPILVAAFFWAMCVPLLTTASGALWLEKTPQELLGRVSALRRMVIMSLMPLATLAAGPLAQRVFEPLMAPGGALAGSVGAVIGTGKGRGIGLLLMVMGGLTMLTALGGWLYAPLRHVERDVPDAPPIAAATEDGEVREALQGAAAG